MALCLVDIPQAGPIFTWCLHNTRIVHIIAGLAVKRENKVQSAGGLRKLNILALNLSSH